MGMGEKITSKGIQDHVSFNSEIKTHDEISDLLNSVKTIENDFLNLDLIQDLPDTSSFQKMDSTDHEITAEPEIPSTNIEPSITQNQIKSQLVNDNKSLIKPKSHNYFYKYITKPLISPPDPGNTTFNIKLKDQAVEGFYEKENETRPLKELLPFVAGKLKLLAKKVKDIDVKNMKNISPSIIKKKFIENTPSIIKNLPTRIHSLFSSD